MKVLIIDSCNQILVDTLELNGFKCIYKPEISENEVLKIIADFEGIISHSKITFSKSIVDRAKKLRFIGRIGANLGNIDTKYAEKKGILCIDAHEGIKDAVAEHAIGMLLNLFNNICRANMQVKNGIWKREANRGIEIGDKTVGIIGYGNVGSAFAKKLSGFDVNILAYDKYKKGFEDHFCKESTLEDLFENCDILSLHIPLKEDTMNLVDYTFLKNFKKNIYLINTSRGQIVKTEDLANAIMTGKVLGAALDVLEFEKTSFEKLHFTNMPESLQYLVDSDSVLLSPHIAGWTIESEFKSAKFLSKKIIEVFGSVIE